MLEDFSLLAGVSPIGFGDPEMIRDQVVAYVPALTPPQVLIHNGGMVDVYSRVPLTTGITQVTTDSSGKAQLGGAIYEFSRSQVPGSAVPDTVPFYITKNVTTLTSAVTTATVTTSSPHGFTTGDSITIIGATPAAYNGTFTITVTGASTFTYTCTNGLSTPATGIITANKQLPYTTSNTYSQTLTLTSIVRVGTVATATLNNHGLSQYRWVQIAGASPAGYNGWFQITNVTQNTFTYTCPNGLSSPATGTITATATIPANDYGFSDRQFVTVDFGITYASMTASFNLKYFQDIDGLQEYLDDPTRRVLCADLMPRGYNLYLLTVNIIGYNGPSPDSELCTTVVTEYLAGLAPGELFVLADLTSKLNAAGVVTIKTPIDVSYRYFNRDLIPYQSGTITDFFEPNDRTAIFMLETLTTQNQTV